MLGRMGASVRNRGVRVFSSEMVYEGTVFRVRRDRVAEPGSIVVTRDIVVHNGSVVLLPIFRDKTILLVRQYRHALRAYLWELVAGRVESKESTLAAARRELLEETGYTARRLRQILEIFPSPGFVSERMWIFAATGLTRGAAEPEEDERITPRRFSLPVLERMIRRGSLRDAKSVAAILFSRVSCAECAPRRCCFPCDSCLQPVHG
jgi:ADP-ribose pyrophosphatase